MDNKKNEKHFFALMQRIGGELQEAPGAFRIHNDNPRIMQFYMVPGSYIASTVEVVHPPVWNAIWLRGWFVDKGTSDSPKTQATLQRGTVGIDFRAPIHILKYSVTIQRVVASCLNTSKSVKDSPITYSRTNLRSARGRNPQ